MQEELYGEIFAAEQEHWWFVARHRIVLHLLERYLQPNSGAPHKVADLGCGCGMMLLRLSEKYEPVGLDGSRHAIEFARRRGVTAKLGALPGDVPLSRESYDAVLMLDVLEHLKYDRASVEVAASLLKPVELLSHLNAILFAPAAMWRILAAKVFERDRARYLRLPPFNSVLRSIFAFERLLLGKVPMPLGLSFIAIARKR